MSKVRFVLANGESREIKVDAPTSVMELAVSHGIPDIVAECGGACACGTCHVYLDDDSYARISSPGLAEQSMLEFTAAPNRPTSRLGCQVCVEAGMEITVTVPDRQ